MDRKTIFMVTALIAAATTLGCSTPKGFVKQETRVLKIIPEPSWNLKVNDKKTIDIFLGLGEDGTVRWLTVEHKEPSKPAAKEKASVKKLAQPVAKKVKKPAQEAVKSK